jgi:hypothetical protein
MNKNMMNILLIGGGAAALYWYLNNYGPAGAAFNTAGQQIAATWWGTWFGTATAAAAPVTTASTNPLASSSVNTPTSPVSQSTSLPAVPVNTASPSGSGPVNTVSIQSQMQASANSNSIIQAQGGLADAYQWATVWNGIGQPSINDVNTIFYPNGLNVMVGAAGMSQQGLPLISLSQFLSSVQGSGISTGISGMGALRGIIDLPSFGGNKGFSGAFKGARGNKAVN